MRLTMKEKILEAAEKRVRGAGFAEMSFRDIASDVGIKSASVHYHFPTKPDLGEALVERYSDQFKKGLDAIDTSDLSAALEGFVALYADALVTGEAICLCAVMGAEAIGLPEKVNAKTMAFFKMNRQWVEYVLDHHGHINATDKAALLVAALEGGMIVASASNDRRLFEGVARAAIQSVLD